MARALHSAHGSMTTHPALLRPALALVTTLTLLCAPDAALADRGTARLRSGGVVTGEIEVYVPSERIVIRTDSGEVHTIPMADVQELEIVPERAATRVAAPPAPAAPAVSTAPAPAVSTPPATAAPGTTTYVVVPGYGAHPYAEQPPAGYRLDAPQPPPGRRPSLFWPLMTLTGSAAAFVSGTFLLTEGLWYCDSSYGDYCGGPVIGGAVLMGLSLPLFILSASFLLPRKVRARRRYRAAQRDYRLSLRPDVDAARGQYGAAATLSF